MGSERWWKAGRKAVGRGVGEAAKPGDEFMISSLRKAMVLVVPVVAEMGLGSDIPAF